MKLGVEVIFVGLAVLLLIYMSQGERTSKENQEAERVVIMPGYHMPNYSNPYYNRYPHYYPHISHHQRRPYPRRPYPRRPHRRQINIPTKGDEIKK